MDTFDDERKTKQKQLKQFKLLLMLHEPLIATADVSAIGTIQRKTMEIEK